MHSEHALHAYPLSTSCAVQPVNLNKSLTQTIHQNALPGIRNPLSHLSTLTPSSSLPHLPMPSSRVPSSRSQLPQEAHGEKVADLAVSLGGYVGSIGLEPWDHDLMPSGAVTHDPGGGAAYGSVGDLACRTDSREARSVYTISLTSRLWSAPTCIPGHNRGAGDR